MTSPTHSILSPAKPFAAQEALMVSLAVQEGLARFDLLTVLITNEAFFSNASPPLFAKLLRVSKKHRAILNTERMWERFLSTRLKVSAQFMFQGVDASVNRLDVMQGLFCYLIRLYRRKPPTKSMLEKENRLWAEVYRDQTLYSKVSRYCQVIDPSFQFPTTQHSSSPNKLSIEERINIAERMNFTIVSPIEIWSDYRGMTISRNVPRRGDAYVSKLLPFTIPGIDQAGKCVNICNISFLEVSGWPKVFSMTEGLTNENGQYRYETYSPLSSLQGMPNVLPSLRRLDLGNLGSLEGMPEMPKLTTLHLEGSFESLESMPRVLPSLDNLRFNCCKDLKSLKGMPEMPKLTALCLQGSFENLEGMPRALPSLTYLHFGCYEYLKSLKGMPETPSLESLHLNGPFESLEGMPRVLPSLTSLHFGDCKGLKSLKGISEMPKLLELHIAYNVDTLVDVPEEFPALINLTVGSNKPHNVLSQLPRMPKLEQLVLSKSVVSLADLHLEESPLRVLDLKKCHELKSLDEMPSLPNLEVLHTPRSIRRIRGLAKKLPSLKQLHLDAQSPLRSDRSCLTKLVFGNFGHRWNITSSRISGLPKGCRVNFSKDYEFIYGNFSSWFLMERKYFLIWIRLIFPRLVFVSFVLGILGGAVYGVYQAIKH